MDVIILSLLLAVGVWAEQLPVKTLHDSSEIENETASVVWENHLPVKTHQDYSGITSENTSVVRVDQPSVKTQQDGSEISNENISVVRAFQLPVKSGEPLANKVFDNAVSGCGFPFEPVGNNCYFFSDEQRTFDDAVKYCKSLGHDHTYEVILAMLDYDRNENQALLETITTKKNTFWVGGKTDDGVHWKWLDNRDIYLQAPFWYYDEPNEAANKCMVAQVSTYDKNIRSYLYDYACDQSLNFICQIGCPSEFRRIGKYCYFLSEEVGLGRLSWQDSRDYCLALSVPEGYHADLAVLDLPDQDSYHLMNDLVMGYTYCCTWVGAYAETDCNYKWVDGRSLPASSTYWVYHDPSCGSNDRVVINHNKVQNRTYLYDYSETSSFPFICQMFKD